jgi:hypothetical protein
MAVNTSDLSAMEQKSDVYRRSTNHSGSDVLLDGLLHAASGTFKNVEYRPHDSDSSLTPTSNYLSFSTTSSSSRCSAFFLRGNNTLNVLFSSLFLILVFNRDVSVQFDFATTDSLRTALSFGCGVSHLMCVNVDSKIQDAAAIAFTRAFYAISNAIQLTIIT